MCILAGVKNKKDEIYGNLNGKRRLATCLVADYSNRFVRIPEKNLCVGMFRTIRSSSGIVIII